MTITIYVDQHVQRAVTEGLRTRGIDVLTPAEDGTSDRDDEELLQRVTELGRVFVTHDRDFPVIASAW